MFYQSIFMQEVFYRAGSEVFSSGKEYEWIYIVKSVSIIFVKSELCKTFTFTDRITLRLVSKCSGAYSLKSKFFRVNALWWGHNLLPTSFAKNNLCLTNKHLKGLDVTEEAKFKAFPCHLLGFECGKEHWTSTTRSILLLN